MDKFTPDEPGYRRDLVLRATEAVEAYDRWKEIDDRLAIETGYYDEDEEEAFSAMLEENSSLEVEIIDMPAHTIEGLKLKARVVIWDLSVMDSPGLTEEDPEIDGAGCPLDYAVMLSRIARDLIRLAA